jgi:amino acid permease
MTIFIIKITIIAFGFSMALANFVKYMETKDRQRLKRAALFFFGSWLLVVLIVGVRHLFFRH